MLVRNKLILSVCVPVLAIAAIGLNTIRQKLVVVNEMSQVEALTHFAVEISEFVHEAQKERGLTAGFISSNGEKFRNELVNQHKVTDGKLAVLQETLASKDTTVFSERLQHSLSRAMESIDDLDQMRSSILSMKLPLGEALGYYTYNHAELLDAVAEMSAESTDSKLATQFVVYASYLQAKERVGIERAVLTGVFTRDSIDLDTYARFINLVSEQDMYLHEYRIYAGAEQIRGLDQIESSSIFQHVQSFRDIVYEKQLAGDFGVDAQKWFSAATEKIDKLKFFENTLSENLLASALSARDIAKSVAISTAGILTAVIATIIVIGVFITRSLLGPLTKLRSIMSEMASGEKDLSNRADDQRSDELGKVASAFNRFVEMLQQSNEREKIKADDLKGKVKQLLVVAQAASDGNLTLDKPYESDDDLGELANGFDSMFDNISLVLNEVIAGSAQINAGAQQCASASQQLSEGATQQAASLEEVAASLEEVGAMINQNADNATQASTLSDEAQANADKGSQEMVAMNEAMVSIKDSSEEISKIIKVIDDIAFQTNLLALNAAVEAARAGEHGKGFAVVAEEVRNLAMRSAEAAKNTSQMIEQSVDRANNGVSIASRVGEALSEIVNSSGKVNTLLTEIASASKEQAEGIDQINKGVSELDKVTQQNAGNSEELAAGAQETAAQVSSLRDTVSAFKTRGIDMEAGLDPRSAVKYAADQHQQEPVLTAASAAALGNASDTIQMDTKDDFESF